MRILKTSLLTIIYSFSMFAQWYFQNPLPQGNYLSAIQFIEMNITIVAGVYFYQLISGSNIQTKKMILIK